MARQIASGRALGNILGLIVHLDRASARSRNVALLQGSLPFPAEILSAVDAQTMRPEERAAYQSAGIWSPRYPFTLSETEIAVFHSYRAAWKRIAGSGYAAGFVVEDDVALDGKVFTDAMDLARGHISERCWIRFPWKPREQAEDVLATNGNISLFRAHEVGLGMQAQVVGRQTAAHLLEVTEAFDRPVDTALQMTWVTGLQPLVVWPSGVRDISAELGGSTLAKRQDTVLSRISREVRRAAYRRAIAWYARRAP